MSLFRTVLFCLFGLVLGSPVFAEEALYPLWDPNVPVPKAADISQLEGVEFHTLFARSVEDDGYKWLHGVTIARFGERWLVSWGHNKGAENTITEVVRGRWSDDDFKTVGPTKMIAAGNDQEAQSHGITTVRDGTLRGFFLRFKSGYKDIHTEAFKYDEKNDKWDSVGSILADQFWPMAEPIRMDDGNWIVAGFKINGTYQKGHHPPAVAISHGDDWSRWSVVEIENPYPGLWCESGIWVDGQRVVCIARGRDPWAYVATSDDFGKSWTKLKRSNMPMAASKPYVGTLSTGEHYLIGATTVDTGNRRCPLTIALTEKGSEQFDRVFKIRGALREGEDPKVKKTRLSYPYAIEHDGRLYVVYSCRRGDHRAELAIIPLESLRK
jgi:BNR repeat-like domain